MKAQSAPWLSIIIPAYNAANYIRNCFTSIVGNDQKGVEVIVIDDGSTDGTGTLCDRYAGDHPFFHVIHDTNHGPSAARVHGLKEATGDWVWFVDSDDVILQGSLVCLRAALNGSDERVMNIGYRFFTNDEGPSILPAAVPSRPLRTVSEDFLRALYRGSFEHFLPTYLFRRRLLMDLRDAAEGDPTKAFPLITGLSLYEDVVGIEGLLRTVPTVGVMRAPYYGVRRNPSSLTHRPDTSSSLSGLRAVRLISAYPAFPGAENDKVCMELALLFSAYKLLEFRDDRQPYTEQFRVEIRQRVRQIGVRHLNRHCLIRYLLFESGLMDIILRARSHYGWR